MSTSKATAYRFLFLNLLRNFFKRKITLLNHRGIYCLLAYINRQLFTCPLCSKMRFEKICAVEPQRCIAVSEARERSMDSAANMREYIEQFRDLVRILKRYSSTSLKKQPLFVWHDRNSSSWAFEEMRALHELHTMLLEDAKACFDNCDYEGAKEILVTASNVCIEMVNLDFIKTPLVVGMPELQLEYKLAQLFRTKGTLCFNAHMAKTNSKLIKLAYKFVELSNALWRRGHNQEYTNKLLAHYHHAVASTAENFTDTISHSTRAVELYKDQKMLEDHASWSELNNTVHFATVEPVSCPVLSIEAALKLVQ